MVFKDRYVSLGTLSVQNVHKSKTTTHSRWLLRPKITNHVNHCDKYSIAVLKPCNNTSLSFEYNITWNYWSHIIWAQKATSANTCVPLLSREGKDSVDDEKWFLYDTPRPFRHCLASHGISSQTTKRPTASTEHYTLCLVDRSGYCATQTFAT